MPRLEMQNYSEALPYHVVGPRFNHYRANKNSKIHYSQEYKQSEYVTVNNRSQGNFIAEEWVSYRGEIEGKLGQCMEPE